MVESRSSLIGSAFWFLQNCRWPSGLQYPSSSTPKFWWWSVRVGIRGAALAEHRFSCWKSSSALRRKLAASGWTFSCGFPGFRVISEKIIFKRLKYIYIYILLSRKKALRKSTSTARWSSWRRGSGNWKKRRSPYPPKRPPSTGPNSRTCSRDASSGIRSDL